MNKAEFLNQLRKALGRLPHYEVEQSIAFYSEMIDDRVEDGMGEQAAVSSLGSIDEIASHIMSEMPIVPKTIAKANTGSKTLNIVLLVVFSPVWIPIALALIAVAFSIWLTLWILIFSLWLVVFSLVVAGIVAVIGAIVLLIQAHPLTALLSLGSGFICVGIGLFSYFGVLAASKGLFELTKLFTRKIRSLFVREGAKQ
jgi:uncharacterized membrane protein